MYEILKKKLGEIPDDHLTPPLKFFNRMPLWSNRWAYQVAHYFWIGDNDPIPKDIHFKVSELHHAAYKELADKHGTKSQINIYGTIWECNVFKIPMWEFSKQYFLPTNETRWATKRDLYFKDDGYIVHKIRIIGKINFYINLILQDMEYNKPTKNEKGEFIWKCRVYFTFWDHYQEIKPYFINGFIKFATNKKEYLIRVTKTKDIYENMVMEDAE
jgi:hypothetical protein